MLFSSFVFHCAPSGLVWLYDQRTHPGRQNSDSDSNGYRTARDETAREWRGAAISQTSWSSRWPNSGVWGQVPRKAQPKCPGHHCSGPPAVLNMSTPCPKSSCTPMGNIFVCLQTKMQKEKRLALAKKYAKMTPRDWGKSAPSTHFQLPTSKTTAFTRTIEWKYHLLNKFRVYSQVKFSAHCLVWGAMSSSGLSELHVVPQGTTINAEY